MDNPTLEQVLPKQEDIQLVDINLIKPHPKNKLATIAEISQAHLLSFQLCFNLYQSSEKNNLNNDIQNPL